MFRSKSTTEIGLATTTPTWYNYSMERAKITAEQNKAVQNSKGRPVRLIDDAGNDTSVAIVRLELLQTLAGEDFDIADTYPAQETALASIWGNEPQLDEYTDQDGSPID